MAAGLNPIPFSLSAILMMSSVFPAPMEPITSRDAMPLERSSSRFSSASRLFSSSTSISMEMSVILCTTLRPRSPILTVVVLRFLRGRYKVMGLPG